MRVIRSLRLLRGIKRRLLKEKIENELAYIEQSKKLIQMHQEILDDRLKFQQEIIGVLDTQVRLVEKITGKVLWDKIEELNLTIKDSNLSGGVHLNKKQ